MEPVFPACKTGRKREAVEQLPIRTLKTQNSEVQAWREHDELVDSEQDQTDPTNGLARSNSMGFGDQLWPNGRMY